MFMEIRSLSNKQSIENKAHVAISPLNKGLGLLDRALEDPDIAQLNWNLLREDLSLPTAVIYEEKLLHNLNWMKQFISAYGVKLAPHGKTTMAPRLFDLQLQAGAWGITLRSRSPPGADGESTGWQAEHGNHCGPSARSRV
jgi:D-serine dehydratase